MSRLLGNQGTTATKDQAGGSGKMSASLGSVFRGLSTSSTSQPSQSQLNKNASSTANSQSNLSEEEKKQRREMLTKAANERSAQWEKKVATAKLKTKNVAGNQQLHNNNFSNEITNPETLKVIQKTKEQEENLQKVKMFFCLLSHPLFLFSIGPWLQSF
jgi:flagellar biosynthesis GTPase FlhF